jgi:hypothetical protein
MLDHSCQVQRHVLADRKNDLYQTPLVAVHALLRMERLPHKLWEPAAGRGAIVGALRVAGHDVTASDLVDYGQPGQIAGIDFLMERKMPEGCEGIVTNPPFKLDEEFVEKALELSPLVVMLLRLAFYESDKRRAILERCGLRNIYAFRKRLPMMHRDQWDGPKANSGMAFAWYVWDRAHTGPTVISRISWEGADGPA